MFSQGFPFLHEASRNCFSDDFELDFGGVFGARSAHFLVLFAPVTNACMFFGSQLTSSIFSVNRDVEESKNSSQGR